MVGCLRDLRLLVLLALALRALADVGQHYEADESLRLHRPRPDHPAADLTASALDADRYWRVINEYERTA